MDSKTISRILSLNPPNPLFIAIKVNTFLTMQRIGPTLITSFVLINLTQFVGPKHKKHFKIHKHRDLHTMEQALFLNFVVQNFIRFFFPSLLIKKKKKKKKKKDKMASRQTSN